MKIPRFLRSTGAASLHGSLRFRFASGILGALCLLMPLAQPASSAQSDYLFMPGHGLTDRTSGVRHVSIESLIKDCKATGSWMRFIERDYSWSELQGSGSGNTPGPFKVGTPGNPGNGIGRIVQEAIACERAGLKLRVMIAHKFTTLPAFLTANDGKYATGKRGETANIKLDQDVVLGFLQALYQKVISELQKSPEAVSGFYGFVIQEHEVGTSTYWTPVTREKWIYNLKRFHLWLAGRELDPRDGQWKWAPGRLRDFDVRSATPHRLFWQMINSPTREVTTIIAHLLNKPTHPEPASQLPGLPGLPGGGGICGPDTFPREPGPPASQGPARGALYRCYVEMRKVRDILPMSLHVYHLNYWNPYVHAAKNNVDMSRMNPRDMDPLITPQPIWGRHPEAPSISGMATPGINDNGNAGIGIANFLGCVPADQQDPDNLRVNNIVWSTSTTPPPEAKYQNNGKPVPDFGWPDVRDWMNNAGRYGPGKPDDSEKQFVRTPGPAGFYNGGCNTITPLTIRN
ncbi:MAG: hypothetical protein KBA71_06075 [Opitutaceae bacterium]|nr:hypothetical protein [Opitutaceae bacterium]